MKIAGAILTGGQSSRFGSDKAVALYDGLPLIAHVHAALMPQCQTVIVAGRAYGGLVAVDDMPRGDMGPLGGLCAALNWARDNGFEAVLSAPCDCPELPRDLFELLSYPDAFIESQPVIGLWNVEAADHLLRWLERTQRKSMLAWIEETSARAVKLPAPLMNVNYPSDLVG